jgi:hypothetical protein
MNRLKKLFTRDGSHYSILTENVASDSASRAEEWLLKHYNIQNFDADKLRNIVHHQINITRLDIHVKQWAISESAIVDSMFIEIYNSKNVEECSHCISERYKVTHPIQGTHGRVVQAHV